MKLGVLADCFGLPLHEGIQTAARLGAQGVQLYAVEGELSVQSTGEYRRVLARLVADSGLAISAVCGDLGWGGFAYPERNPEKIKTTCGIIDLALDLGCTVITTHIGVVPESAEHPRYRVLQDACGAIAEYARRQGACLAIETGPERAETLAAFIDSVNNPALAANLDPANLIMTVHQDSVQAVHALRGKFPHTHAKDGRFFKACDPDVMYEMPGADLNGYDESEYCAEVPLGQGEVDFPRYLAALQASGYDGFLTIERETGDNPARDIQIALDFLRDQLDQLKGDVRHE